MIGLVICSHGQMGAGMVDAAEMIGGPQAQLAVVEVNPGDALEAVGAAVLGAVGEVDEGDGVLVLTDMPGGTPCNVVIPHLAEGRLAMISGFNLPLLLKLLTARVPEAGRAGALARLAALGTEYGQRHIMTGTALGGGRPNDEEG